MIGEAHFHRGPPDAESLMHAPEVALHEAECHGCRGFSSVFENAFVRHVNESRSGPIRDERVETADELRSFRRFDLDLDSRPDLVGSANGDVIPRFQIAEHLDQRA
jgi:hypothetical protein